MELIKRVIFQERHLILSPLVTLEAEKKVVRGFQISKKDNTGEEKPKAVIKRVDPKIDVAQKIPHRKVEIPSQINKSHIMLTDKTIPITKENSNPIKS